MKIYNKKTFCFGVFAVALGVLSVAADFVNKKWEVSGIVLAAGVGLAFAVGISVFAEFFTSLYYEAKN